MKWRLETHITWILIEKCPVGYSNLGNELLSPYCYKDIDETLSWERSRNVCLLHGGDLATIHSKADTQAISERFKDHWLGYKLGKGKFNDCCKWLRGNLVYDMLLNFRCDNIIIAITYLGQLIQVLYFKVSNNDNKFQYYVVNLI